MELDDLLSKIQTISDQSKQASNHAAQEVMHATRALTFQDKLLTDEFLEEHGVNLEMLHQHEDVVSQNAAYMEAVQESKSYEPEEPEFISDLKIASKIEAIKQDVTVPTIETHTDESTDVTETTVYNVDDLYASVELKGRMNELETPVTDNSIDIDATATTTAEAAAIATDNADSIELSSDSSAVSVFKDEDGSFRTWVWSLGMTTLLGTVFVAAYFIMKGLL